MEIRPRRSVLYMPGANARALEKARELPVDGLIFDLEDSVAPEAKAAARAQVAEALKRGGYGPRERVVRINALEGEWGLTDIAAVARAGIHALLVPKVESAEQVRAVAAALEVAGAPPDVGIWAMIETPRGVLSLDAVAGSHPLLRCIVMGTADLGRAMRVPVTPGRQGFQVVLGLAMLAARAHGLDILDGVHLELDDAAGFEHACIQGRNLGFDGKTLIHPRQIEVANRVFAPDGETLSAAQAVLLGWERARSRGQAVVVVNGRLVEALHVEEARRALAMAEVLRRRMIDHGY